MLLLNAERSQNHLLRQPDAGPAPSNAQVQAAQLSQLHAPVPMLPRLELRQHALLLFALPLLALPLLVSAAAVPFQAQVLRQTMLSETPWLPAAAVCHPAAAVAYPGSPGWRHTSPAPGTTHQVDSHIQAGNPR